MSQDDIDKDEEIYNLENKVQQVKQNFSEEANELQMQIRVLRTQIKKQKLRYNKVMEDEIKKTKNEYQEIINEKNKLIQSLQEKRDELLDQNKRLQKQNDRLEIQQKASDYNEIHKTLSERLNRAVQHMNENEDEDDKQLLQMKTEFKELRKGSRFMKKISQCVEKYSEKVRQNTDKKSRLLLISQDIESTYARKMELMKENGTMNEMINNLQGKNSELQSGINQHESTIEEQNKKVEKLTREVDKLRNLPSPGPKPNPELEEQVQKLEIENNKLKADIIDLQDKKQMYKNELLGATSELETTKQKFEKHKDDQSKVQRELDVTKKTVFEQNARLNEKSKAYDTLEKEKQKVAEENKQLIFDNEELQRRLDKAEKDREPLLQDQKVITVKDDENAGYNDSTKSSSLTNKRKFEILAAIICAVIALIVGWLGGSVVPII